MPSAFFLISFLVAEGMTHRLREAIVLSAKVSSPFWRASGEPEAALVPGAFFAAGAEALEGAGDFFAAGAGAADCFFAAGVGALLAGAADSFFAGAAALAPASAARAGVARARQRVEAKSTRPKKEKLFIANDLPELRGE